MSIIPLRKNKLMFFQMTKARHTDSNYCFSIYKNNFKTKLLASKNHFYTKFMIHNMAFDRFVGISGKTFNTLVRKIPYKE